MLNKNLKWFTGRFENLLCKGLRKDKHIVYNIYIYIVSNIKGTSGFQILHRGISKNLIVLFNKLNI